MCPAAHQHPDDVGQVVLALRILGGETLQSLSEQVPVENVDTAVDLPHGCLVLVGVLQFDDAQEPPGFVAHHPAKVAVVDFGCQHRRRCISLLVRFDEVPNRRTGQERHIARKDEDRASTDLHTGHPGPNCVTGAELLILQTRHHSFRQDLLDLSGSMPDDHHDLVESERLDGVENPLEERQPGQVVQHLGGVGLHAGARTGGKHQGFHRHSCPPRLWAGRRGLEPLLTGPKPVVLPITPPPTDEVGRARPGQESNANGLRRRNQPREHQRPPARSRTWREPRQDPVRPPLRLRSGRQNRQRAMDRSRTA